MKEYPKCPYINAGSVAAYDGAAQSWTCLRLKRVVGRVHCEECERIIVRINRLECR